MKPLHTLTLLETKKLLDTKEISLKDLYTDLYKEIDIHNKELNIFLSVDRSSSEKAEQVREKILSGIPFAVKDNFLTVGLPTTASSSILEGFMPPYESTVTRKLKEAGGIVLGKTNMDAWAHGSSTETSDYGVTKNPRNPEYLPGGSSGGSAAALAQDLCIAALGSETAGSIRQPSAWCGTVGLKPTYGRVSRAGVVAMGSSLDSPGPMTKTIEDAAFMLPIIAGKDPYDGTTSERPIEDYAKTLKTGVKGMKIGITYIDHPQLKGTQTAKAIEDAGKVFERLGANVEMVSLSEDGKVGTIMNPDYAISVYTVVQRGEVSSNLGRYDGIRYGKDRSNFGDEAKRRIMLGTFTLSKGYADKYYTKAQQVRSMYIKNYDDLFKTYDILISPTSPGYALKLGATAGNPMFGELEDLLLEASSISGLPGANVPCFYDSKTNLYLGLNIIAKQWNETDVIKAAYAFETETPWNPWRKQQ